MIQDFRDIVAELVRAEARFLIVGAHALGLHGVARATADLDLWIEPSNENVDRVWRALAAFGAPMETLGIRPSDLTRPNIVAQFGLPPYRIDVLTGVSGLTFEDAWNTRVEAPFEDVRAPFIGRDAFIQNKRATGRTKDRADLEALGEN